MDNQFNFDGSPMPPKPEKKKGDGFATASLVLGIVALVLSVAGICAILAIVFSVISLQKSGKNGKAIAGLVLGIVALLIVIIIIIAVMTSSSDTPGAPDLSTDQKVIDWMYRWMEKTVGKEFADEWYQEMMKALQGSSKDPFDTGALE